MARLSGAAVVAFGLVALVGCDVQVGETNRATDHCSGVCGDTCIDPGEECDHGTANSDRAPDACRSNCQWAHCGDGVVDTGEECDQMSLNSDLIPDRCRLDCSAPSCGDGVIDTGEQCDDGNDVDDDECRNDCTLLACDAGTCAADLATCQADLSSCNGDLGQCGLDLGACDAELAGARAALASCESELANVTADDDGDGVPAVRDDCPNTAAGAVVDADGCSLEQFCGSILIASRSQQRLCAAADFNDDEPGVMPRDCVYGGGRSCQAP